MHADTVETVRVEYFAPPECPSESTFFRRVRSRTARASLDQTGSTDGTIRTFRVRIEHDEGFRGTLLIEGGPADPEGGTVRELTAASCEVVVAALSLFTALAIDARRSIDSAEPGDTSERATPRVQNSRPPSPSLRQNVEALPRTRRNRWHFVAGTGIGVTTGVAPEPLLSVPVAALLARDGAPWSPSFGLRIHHADGKTYSSTAGRFTMKFDAVQFLSCPVSTGMDRWLVFRPCALLELGVLGAGPIGPLGSVRRNDAEGGWLALGAAMRADAAIVDRLRLAVELGVAAPVVRERFFFFPNVTATQVASLGARIVVGFEAQLF